VATEEEVTQVKAHPIEHADTLAERVLLMGDPPEAHLEALTAHAHGIGDLPSIELGRLGHVEESHAPRRRLDASSGGGGLIDVRHSDAPVATRDGEDALDALAVDLRAVDRGVDLAEAYTGTVLGIGYSAMHAISESLKVFHHALDHALGATLAEAE
jgi:hypothetical protein